MMLRRPAYWRVIVPVLLVVVAYFDVRVGAQSWPCPEKPVEPCFKHHGRLSSQNGIALALWLIGTTRRVGLANDFMQLPPAIQRYLVITSPQHSYVYGDFEICPLEPDTPGHLRQVCVVGAEKLVVENLQALRPPFRLLSTWPASKSQQR